MRKWVLILCTLFLTTLQLNAQQNVQANNISMKGALKAWNGDTLVGPHTGGLYKYRMVRFPVNDYDAVNYRKLIDTLAYYLQSQDTAYFLHNSDLAGIRDTLAYHSDSLSRVFDSLLVHRGVLDLHTAQITSLQNNTQEVIFRKEADSTASALYPINLSALSFLPDSRYVPMNVPVVNARSGDTVSLGMVIGAKQIYMAYGIADGAGGLISYGVKVQGDMDVSGRVSGSNLDKSYEYELTADDENNLPVGFTILPTTKVFYNGVAIPSNQWSGVGGSTLILAVDRRKYDKVLVTN